MAWDFKDTRWAYKSHLQLGGQAHTYIVRDKQEEYGDCVLKRLRDPTNIGRFRREIEASCKLQHQNIVKVIDADGLDHNPPYLVTEYCSAGTLEDCDLSAKTVVDRLQMFIAICDGVAHAHSKGITHRDLKPANVFQRTDGTPVIGDFGMCFLDDDNQRFTIYDQVGGARGGYTAPELRDGRAEEVTAKTDVYSLGKLLYWLLARRSFDREAHRDARFDLTTGDRHQDSEIEIVYELLDKSIALDPRSRFVDANEFAQETRSAIERIKSRRRIFELCGLNRAPKTEGVLLGSFREGSIVSWRNISESTDFIPIQFMVSDRTFAVCGTNGRQPTGQVSLNYGPDLSVPTRVDVDSDSEVYRGGERRVALAFNSQDTPIFAYVVKDKDAAWSTESCQLRILMRDEIELKYRAVTLVDSIGQPRSYSVASDGNDQIAVYLGGDGPGRLIVKTGDDVVEHSVGNVTWLAPITFDSVGALHQAMIVTKRPEGVVRELRHHVRQRNGELNESIIDEAGDWSPNIALAVRPNDTPVIVCPNHFDHRSILVYECVNQKWQKEEIDLRLAAKEASLAPFNTHQVMQVVCDESSCLHIALLSNVVFQGDVAYIRLNPDLSVQSLRYFPAFKFWGLGVDGRGYVHLAIWR